MIDTLTFRRMQLEDLDRVQEIERESFTTPWSRSAFVNELTNNYFAYYLVAMVDATIAAYGGMWLILDEAHVTNIAVHPDFRRQHIGERLLMRMMSIARQAGLSGITLEVRVSNTSAQHLYRKLGFAVKGVRRGYYTDNHEDAYIMWADLDQAPQGEADQP